MRLSGILTLVLVSFGTHPSWAQLGDSLISHAEEIAAFREAKALAIDPSGILFVVDAGSENLQSFEPLGKPIQTYGGPGTANGQFDEPTDIDPTNGLLWVVADAGNSRLQRFSRKFQHLESLQVARVTRFTPGVTERTANIGGEGSVQEADGFPIAVVVTRTSETFAIDAAQNVVLKWDASRRRQQAIGGFDSGEGALVEPIALAANDNSLFVADRELASVLAYDFFGGYERTFAPGRAEEVKALAVVEQDLWIVLPNKVMIYEAQGGLRSVLDVDMGEELVDVDFYAGYVYFLTSTRLLRTAL